MRGKTTAPHTADSKQKGCANIEITPDYMIIRSLRMANHLAFHGHKISKVVDSEKDHRFKVFLFQDSPELRHCMAQFHSVKEG